jgi:DNA repair protein RadC
MMHEVAREFLKEKIITKPVYQSTEEVFNYLYHSMRDLKKEVFKVIYLNSQNQIIEVEDLCRGTPDRNFISPREVVEGALRHYAAAMIFVHNHPSGNPQPSLADKETTRDLVYATDIVQARVLDHIIIGDNSYFSFAEAGLIEDYRTDLLDIKIKDRTETRRNRYDARPR